MIKELLTKQAEVNAQVSALIDTILKPFEARMESADKSELYNIYTEAMEKVQLEDERILDTADWFMFTNYYIQLKEE